MNDNKIKYILNLIVKEARTKLDINDPTTRLCKESSLFVAKLCDINDIPYIPFSMSEIGMPELEHHYGITGFMTDVGQVCFLIDLTYIQFTDKLYPVNVKGEAKTINALSPGNFISNENKDNLLKKGYIVLTESNFYDYFGSFIETNKRVNKIEEEKIYQKIYSKFNSFGINILDDNYLNKKEKR